MRFAKRKSAHRIVCLRVVLLQGYRSGTRNRRKILEPVRRLFHFTPRDASRRGREGKIGLEADGASARRPANRDDLEEVGERGCYGSSYAARKRHNERKCCRRKINELRRRTLAWRVHGLKTENSVACSRIYRVKIRWARWYNFNDSRALKNLLFKFTELVLFWESSRFSFFYII